MALTFPVTLPVGLAAKPAWPDMWSDVDFAFFSASLQSAADNLWYPYPFWFGLDYTRCAGDKIVASICKPHSESRFGVLEVWQADGEDGVADPADSTVIETQWVHGHSIGARADGILDLFYVMQTSESPRASAVYHRHSRDSGRTWSAAENTALSSASIGALTPGVYNFHPYGGWVEQGRLSNNWYRVSHCYTLDGLLVLAIHANPVSGGGRCWVSVGVPGVGGRWVYSPASVVALSTFREVKATPWGGADVVQNWDLGFNVVLQSIRSDGTFQVGASDQRYGVFGPGVASHIQGAGWEARTVSPPLMWEVVWKDPWAPLPTTRYLNVLETFRFEDTSSQAWIPVNAKLGLRGDGALELFYLTPAQVPTLRRNRNPSTQPPTYATHAERVAAGLAAWL